MDSYNLSSPSGNNARNAHDARLRAAANASHDAAFDIASTQQQLDHVAMICEAMWELIKSRTDLTDTDLMGKMAELDLSDGVADGKVTRGPKTCPNCSRPNTRRRELCLYCGTPLKTKPFE